MVEEEKSGLMDIGEDDSGFDSDVDLDGVDMEGDEEVANETSMSIEQTSKGEEATEPPANDEQGSTSVSELHDYDEVVLEHERQLKELREKEAAAPQVVIKSSDDVSKRIQYLMAQSEVFTHFLESTTLNKNNKKLKSRTRMEEVEEDSILMKQAQSKARVTRVLKQPDSICAGTMRDYQLEGLNWMIKLHDNGINGILADEMGLGKTLQCISLLAYLKEARNINGPHLIIVPKSTVGNWMKEFERWCPTINVVKLLGDKATRKSVCETIIAKGHFSVVVTSYECTLKEKSTLAKINWKYLVIDEAHRIKNECSSLSKQVRLMKTQFRLLITGTPLQNNLHELWALLNFLLPDVFSNSEDFDSWFNVTGDTEQQENVVKKLHTVLRPFMLRRIKADVEKDLPPKKEIKLYMPLTKMQREWYKKILSKDAYAFNSLGGPDRVRLLNVLMQLRKVCNHPYLFDGAEPGPPFINGPHIFESSGKLKMLNKLLPKLKAQGSRVLIFSQMTRLLDILEDYMHMCQYEYCRIDGSTDGEERDRQMAQFNAPNSPFFCFLLSTRAGGLGINLQTADTVVLYDSDWNPQADLQAMDRAHRIGQTKPVKVFRFISEGTVEEKIVERADRKLFLDAAVIQQGRLAEKHAQLSKDELMVMVKFGADNILKWDESEEITEEDIDALLHRGEEKTNLLKEKIEQDMRHSLANFSLTGDGDQPSSLFDFEGENHKKSGHHGTLFELPQRERKKNYDIDAYYRTQVARPAADRAAANKRRRGINMQDFQFYKRPQLEAIFDKEQQLHDKKQFFAGAIKDIKNKIKKGQLSEEEEKELEEEADSYEEQIKTLVLTPKEEAEKKKLVDEGFGDWSRKDLRIFVSAMERNGRDDKESVVREVCQETGKEEADVLRYYTVFWKRYEEVADHAKYLERIVKGERRIARSSEIKLAIETKVSRCKNPWQQLTINYGGAQGKIFTEEEDAFLVNMMHRFGYGMWEAIRLEIRKAWQFRFDWFFKSRNAAELQRRGDTLIRLLERENEEHDTAQRGQAKKRKSSTGTGGGGSAAAPASKKKRK